jgi:hypothetical protein
MLRVHIRSPLDGALNEGENSLSPTVLSSSETGPPTGKPDRMGRLLRLIMAETIVMSALPLNPQIAPFASYNCSRR